MDTYNFAFKSYVAKWTADGGAFVLNQKMSIIKMFLNLIVTDITGDCLLG